MRHCGLTSRQPYNLTPQSTDLHFAVKIIAELSLHFERPRQSISNITMCVPFSWGEGTLWQVWRREKNSNCCFNVHFFHAVTYNICSELSCYLGWCWTLPPVWFQLSNALKSVRRKLSPEAMRKESGHIGFPIHANLLYSNHISTCWRIRLLHFSSHQRLSKSCRLVD